MNSPMKSNAAAAFSLLVVASCLTLVSKESTAQSVIRVDGSSTVFPITESVAESFREKNSGVKVTIGIAGTGGGFKKFCKGETDISDASRPILKKEMTECAKNGVTYLELPIAFDAITVVIHPKNKFLTKITIDELKKNVGASGARRGIDLGSSQSCLAQETY